MEQSIQSFKQKFVYLPKNDPYFTSSANKYKKEMTAFLKEEGGTDIKVKIGRYYISTTFTYIKEQKISIGDYLLYGSNDPYLDIVFTNSAGDTKREKIEFVNAVEVKRKLREALYWVGEA